MALDGSGNITIPTWPCDCTAQDLVIKNMLTDIEAQDTLIRSKSRKQLQIFSKTPPSIGQWQSLWLAKGNTLPMPNGVECLWFDTTNNTYGAQYYSVNGLVYPVEMLRYRGLELYSVPATNTTTGLTVGGSTTSFHFDLSDNGTGQPGAVRVSFPIPTQLIGKNYFVRFNVPFWATINVLWTIWYENANLYTTLYGGLSNLGFGVVYTSSSEGVVEWVAEIPAGGVLTTIEVRLSANIGQPSGTIALPVANTSPSLSGRATAEFILKTE